MVQNLVKIEMPFWEFGHFGGTLPKTIVNGLC